MSDTTVTVQVAELEQRLYTSNDPNEQFALLKQLAVCASDPVYYTEHYPRYFKLFTEVIHRVDNKFDFARLLTTFTDRVRGTTISELYVAATSVLEHVIKNLEESGDTHFCARLMMKLADYVREGGNFKTAEKYYQQALAVFNEHNDTERMAQALSQLSGTIRESSASYERALEYAMKAYQISIENGHRVELGFCYNNIANIYGQIGNFQEALIYYRKAAKIAVEISPLHEVLAEYNLAIAYFDCEKCVRSWKMFIAVRRKLRSFAQMPHREAWCLGMMGNILEKKHRYLSALRYYRIAHRLLKDTVAIQDLCTIYQSLARISLKLQQYNKAFLYARRGLSIIKSVESDVNKSALLHHKARALEKLGRHEAANRTYRRYIKLRESEFSKEKQKVMAEMQVKFDVENAEREKELFRMKNVELTAAFDEVRRLNENLTQLNNEKNEVLGVVAHDLKGPLAGVRMVASLLQQHYRRMPAEELEDQLGQIVDTSDRMLAISSNLLHAQRLESADVYGTTAVVDIGEVVKTIAESYRTGAQKKNISLSVECSSPVRTVCSEEALRRAVENIVSNAVKFTPPAGNVWVRVKQAGQKVVVEIEDQGPGIGKSDQRKLYGKYTRLSAHPTGGESSTGLGLWIAKKAVQAMKGRIRCVSDIGKGTTFILEIPV